MISGLGGAVGLWLGWSAMTLGELLIDLLKTIHRIFSVKKK